MAKYTVPLTTLVAFKHEIEVNAMDEEEALEVAREIAMELHPQDLLEEASDVWVHDSMDQDLYEETE